MGDVVVVGSSNTDMVLYVPEIPFPGQTLSGKNFSINGGGKGANQAVAAARAALSTTDIFFIAAVGEDDFGMQALRNYRDSGIKTEYITIDKKSSSGTALIFVADSGENTIGINSGANAFLAPEHIYKAREVITGAAVLLTQLETPLSTVLAALKTAHEAGVATILNPAPAVELPVEFFTLVDYITPNQTETEFYTGIFPSDQGSAAAAAAELRKFGVANVIITLGSAGLFYSVGGKAEFIKAKKVQSVDTVGAGDTFNGAFAAALAMNMHIKDALEFASAAAALSVTRKGAQSAVPYFSEIHEFV